MATYIGGEPTPVSDRVQFISLGTFFIVFMVGYPLTKDAPDIIQWIFTIVTLLSIAMTLISITGVWDRDVIGRIMGANKRRKLKKFERRRRAEQSQRQREYNMVSRTVRRQFGKTIEEMVNERIK